MYRALIRYIQRARVLRVLFTVLAIELGTMLGLYVTDALAQGPVHKVTLRGEVFQSPDASDDFCTFFLIGAGDSESIQSISFSPDSYLCDYMRGSKDVILTIQPVEK